MYWSAIIISFVVEFQHPEKNENTHEWNYDKPYEWGLETLTGKTFVKNELFLRGKKFVCKENLNS